MTVRARARQVRHHEAGDRVVVPATSSLVSPGSGKTTRSGWLMVTPPTAGLPARAGRAGLRRGTGARARSRVARSAPALRPAARAGAGPASGGFGGRRVASGGSPAPRSRTTSAAGLSSRSPLKTGWRSWPSPVHSVKATSATSAGDVQCTPRAWRAAGGSAKGGVRRLELRRSARREPRQRGVVEAAADAAGVAQRALLVVDAEQEGAEAAARPGRLGEAADDELLPAAALGLEPGARAPAGVRAVGALGHQALEALQAGLLEDGVAAALDVVAEPHHAVQLAAAALEQPLQPALALRERQLAQVLAVLEEEVEGDVGRRRPGRPSLSARCSAPKSLTPRSSKTTASPSSHVPGGRQGRERLGDAGEPLRPVQPVAREQAHAVVVDAGGDAVAVVLDLVQPVVVAGRLVDERRQRQRDGGRSARAAAAARALRRRPLAARPPPRPARCAASCRRRSRPSCGPSRRCGRPVPTGPARPAAPPRRAP